jgi:hypothetical protein
VDAALWYQTAADIVKRTRAKAGRASEQNPAGKFTVPNGVSSALLRCAVTKGFVCCAVLMGARYPQPRLTTS